MAESNCLVAEKADNDTGGEIERPAPKEYFTLEGSISTSIMSQFCYRHCYCVFDFEIYFASLSHMAKRNVGRSH